MKKSLLTLFMAVMLHGLFAQDRLYLFQEGYITGSVTEVGVDSIVFDSGHKKQVLPSYKVHYIQFSNGERYFVPQDMISRVDDEMIFAKILDTAGVQIVYHDLKRKPYKERTVHKDEVLSILFCSGEEVFFYDKIVMVSGRILAADILEISDEEITYRHPLKTRKALSVPVSGVDHIRFRSGYLQQFVNLEN